MPWLWDPRFPRRNLWGALGLVVVGVAFAPEFVPHALAQRTRSGVVRGLFPVLLFVGYGLREFHRALRHVPAQLAEESDGIPERAG